MAGGGHPALPRVQLHRIALGRRSRSRRPELASRSGLGEGERAQMAAGRDFAARRRMAVRLDDRGACVVHAGHHRRRGADPGDGFDDMDGGPGAEPPSAHIGGGQQTEESMSPQGFDDGRGKRGGPIHIARVDACGLEDRRQGTVEGFERVGVGRGSSGGQAPPDRGQRYGIEMRSRTASGERVQNRCMDFLLMSVGRVCREARVSANPKRCSRDAPEPDRSRATRTVRQVHPPRDCPTPQGERDKLPAR